MKKQSFSLASIFWTTALITGVTLATTSAAQASSWAINNDITAKTSGNSPTLPSTQLSSEHTSINTMKIIGTGGIAVAASLLVVGMVYKACRAGREANKFLAELPDAASLDLTSLPISIHSEELSASNSEQTKPDSTGDKDLTLVS